VIVSKREKQIAIATAAAVGLFVLIDFVWQPYSDALDQIQTQTDAVNKQLQDAGALFANQHRLAKIWADMQAHGLKTDESQADSQLQHAILDWEQRSGVTQQTLKQDQARKEGDFDVVGYRVTADGSMRSIVQFVWALETATMPIRVTDIRITPEREGGTDQLSVTLGVSTLCASPTPAQPAGAGQKSSEADAGDLTS